MGAIPVCHTISWPTRVSDLSWTVPGLVLHDRHRGASHQDLPGQVGHWRSRRKLAADVVVTPAAELHVERDLDTQLSSYTELELSEQTRLGEW